MAKLHTYYILCPLIDQKSFLGVSQDKSIENVIVALGRNVVNTYRLSDQKQIGGWTSKDHITCMVVYDKEHESYVGVFNNNTIKLWKDDNENLDKLKKYKFPLAIFKVLQRVNRSSLIVLANGNCASLSYGLDNRKSLEGKSLLKASDSITDVASYTHNSIDYICYIVKNSYDKYEIINCPLRNELGDLERAKFHRIKIHKQKESDIHVVGKLISTDEQPVVYILWSDSKISAYDLVKKSWKTIGIVPWISTEMNVTLAWMGEKHLILFGSDSHEDGAIIVAYNVSLGVGSCRYPMKMYFQDAKLYCFNNRIILEAGNHIGMLPYALEASRSLSSLLGSHEVIQEDLTDYADWGNGEVSLTVNKDIEALLNNGLTERAICLNLVPPLLEKDNVKNVQKVLKLFNDVPESVIVMLLEYVAVQTKVKKGRMIDKEKFKEFCTKPQNSCKLSILNDIFRIPFSDALLIPHLRNSLSLDNAVFLLNYISYLLTDGEVNFKADYESKLFDWCALLLDAFYQQYLMTNDEQVTYALENIKNVIMELIQDLYAIDKVLPVLNKLMYKKSLDDDEEILSYTIELMNI